MVFPGLWMAPGMVFAGSVAKRGCPVGKIDWSKIKERFLQYGRENLLFGESGSAELID